MFHVKRAPSQIAIVPRLRFTLIYTASNDTAAGVIPGILAA
jgi:hypothetical protein